MVNYYGPKGMLKNLPSKGFYNKKEAVVVSVPVFVEGSGADNCWRVFIRFLNKDGGLESEACVSCSDWYRQNINKPKPLTWV